MQVLIHVGAVCSCIATCVAIRVIHIRLLVFVAQGIYVIDALTGKFAIFVDVVLDVSVDVVRNRVEAVLRVGKYGRADLFE